MNTDNVAISGETIDYGPCAFMDEFDVHSVFSSIDTGGRYAYANQAAIMQWNLTQLGNVLLPLFPNATQAATELNEALHSFSHHFDLQWNRIIRDKMGITKENAEGLKLVTDFFNLMQNSKPDFTNTFRLLSSALVSEPARALLIKNLGGSTDALEWVQKWHLYISDQNVDLIIIKDKMEHTNPAYIPRNHLVENAINTIINEQNRTLWDELLFILKEPYVQHKNTEHLQCLPTEKERIHNTFCGT